MVQEVNLDELQILGDRGDDEIMLLRIDRGSRHEQEMLGRSNRKSMEVDGRRRRILRNH